MSFHLLSRNSHFYFSYRICKMIHNSFIYYLFYILDVLKILNYWNFYHKLFVLPSLFSFWFGSFGFFYVFIDLSVHWFPNSFLGTLSLNFMVHITYSKSKLTIYIDLCPSHLYLTSVDVLIEKVLISFCFCEPLCL